MLTESLVFALLGSILGVGLAWFGARALVSLAPADLPRLNEIGVDYRVVAFTTAITVATGILFGLAPAFYGVRNDSIKTLRDGGKTSAHGASGVARRALVVVEVALAMVMLTGAGLLVRKHGEIAEHRSRFFAGECDVTMSLTVPPRGYTDTTAVQLFRDVVTSVQRIPGVRSVALDGALPISGDDSDWSIMVDGREIKNVGDSPSAKPQQVTPGYFSTMGIQLVRGREFADADRPGAQPVVVVNQALARKLWPGVDPIGHTLKMFTGQSPWLTVVGVVGDVRARGFQAPIPATMYFPYAQSRASAYYLPRTMSLVARTSLEPSKVANAIRSAVRLVEPRMPVSDVASMDDVVGRSVASRTIHDRAAGSLCGARAADRGLGHLRRHLVQCVAANMAEIGLRMAARRFVGRGTDGRHVRGSSHDRGRAGTRPRRRAGCDGFSAEPSRRRERDRCADVRRWSSWCSPRSCAGLRLRTAGAAGDRGESGLKRCGTASAFRCRRRGASPAWSRSFSTTSARSAISAGDMAPGTGISSFGSGRGSIRRGTGRGARPTIHILGIERCVFILEAAIV